MCTMSVSDNGNKGSGDVEENDIATVIIHRNHESESASVGVSVNVSPNEREEIHRQAVNKIPDFSDLRSGTDIGVAEFTTDGVEFHARDFLTVKPSRETKR